MLSKPEAREAILELLIENYPKDAWIGIERGAAWAYQEARSSTQEDPRFASIPGHRRFRASQERHFLMENALAQVAAQNDLAFAGEVVRANQWVYGMIRTPSICVMQKRVDDGGEPPPARFRRQVATANAFVRQGELFMLDDVHAAGEQPLHGILIHTAKSQRFADEGYGRVAFLRLAFPFGDYSGWAATFGIPELIMAYPEEAKPQPRPTPAPTWRSPQQDEKDEKSGRR